MSVVSIDKKYIKKRKKANLILEAGLVGMLNLGRRREVPEPDKVRSVLIIRHSMLGDAVAVSPFVAAVRDLWPHAKIDVLASRTNHQVFKWVHGVDAVHIRPNGVMKRIFSCFAFRGRYDVVFQTLLDEHYLSRTLAARVIAGPGIAVGRRRGSPLERLFDFSVYVPSGSYVSKLFSLLTPFSDRSVDDWVASHPRHQMTLPPATCEAARKLLAARSLKSGDYVALNISARVDFRDLGVQQAAALAAGCQEAGWPVVLLHSPADEGRAAEVCRLNPSIIQVPTSSLPEAMALAQNARLYLGADTGTAHFAAAGGVSCVVLFAEQASPDAWSPYGVSFASVHANPGQTVSDIDVPTVMDQVTCVLKGGHVQRIVRANPCGFPSNVKPHISAVRAVKNCS